MTGEETMTMREWLMRRLMADGAEWPAARAAVAGATKEDPRHLLDGERRSYAAWNAEAESQRGAVNG